MGIVRDKKKRGRGEMGIVSETEERGTWREKERLRGETGRIERTLSRSCRILAGPWSALSYIHTQTHCDNYFFI